MLASGKKFCGTCMCPPSFEIGSSAYLYRYTNELHVHVSALDPKVRMDLHYLLRNYREKIRTQFACYVSEIYGKIKVRGIDISKIKDFLENVFNFKFDLEQANSLDDIFILLMRRDKTSFGFLNYHIYESLRNKFIPEERDEAFKYPDYLKAYVNKHRLSEFLEINPKLKEIDTSNNIVHIIFDIQAFDNVLELQESLAAVLEIRPSELQILNIEQFLTANPEFQQVREFTPEQPSVELGDSKKLSTEGKGELYRIYLA